jgi:hypothetical protein
MPYYEGMTQCSDWKYVKSKNEPVEAAMQVWESATTAWEYATSFALLQGMKPDYPERHQLYI